MATAAKREVFLPWALFALALAAAPFIFAARGDTPHEGQVIDAAITLITADKPDLSCAMTTAVAGYHCEYQTRTRAFDSGAPSRGLLQPFLTVQRVMFLVPELFAQPALAQRYQRELPDGRDRTAYRRFTAKCRLRLLRRIDANAFVRFGRNAPWGTAPPLWVAEASNCSVDDN